MSELVPLLRVPNEWPAGVVAVAAMVLLAGIDLGMAVVAKEWTTHGGVRLFVLGLAASAVLFWVFASSLAYAELSVVTFGWIVILQVALVIIDATRYGGEFQLDKGIAITVMIAAQAYLILAPSAS